LKETHKYTVWAKRRVYRGKPVGGYTMCPAESGTCS